ncbi:MAG: MBL fold metallo-hydrolase, partial [Dehalococcoidia bacterium]
HCPICEDERQYVGWQGQQWTTLGELEEEGRQNELHDEETGLVSIGTVPSLAIGQRALLLQTPAGNVLWDCIGYLNEETVAAVRRLGGLAAIGISHPHFYGSVVEWSEAFGGVPIYIHQNDQEWVVRKSRALTLWDTEHLEILPGVTLVRLGGHFDGAAVLHWTAGAGGQGALLSGDTIQVVMDRRYVSFMYSYPNLIPLPETAVRHIVDAVRPYPFERLYGAWKGRVVFLEGHDSVERSAERYIRALRSSR